MNSTLQPVFSSIQQHKLRQLQLEIEALEQQISNGLQNKIQPTVDYSSQSSIPLIQIDDNAAKTGVKLADDTDD